MARSRNIKPGFFKNEELIQAPIAARLLFIGLWTLADRNGILEYRPLRIRAEIFPYESEHDVNGYITVLERLGFVQRLTDGKTDYLWIVNFVRHQNPHHTEKTSFPSPESLKKQQVTNHNSDITVKQPLNNGDNPADSLLLIPDSLNLIPEPPIPDFPISTAPIGSVVAAGKKPSANGMTSETWSAFADAYHYRYGIDPIRNAKINGMLAQFVKRVPMEEAPLIAAFFVSHNNSFYVTKGHPISLLLADAEKLRTEWATGRQITATSALQLDQKQSNYDVVQEAIRLDRLEGKIK